jgi:hypothetical protein
MSDSNLLQPAKIKKIERALKSKLKRLENVGAKKKSTLSMVFYNLGSICIFLLKK